MDRVLEKLQDGSVKVVLHTLACVSRIHSDSPLALGTTMQQIVLPALLEVASSSNKQVSLQVCL